MATKSLALLVLLMLNSPFFNTAQEICEDGWIRFEDSMGSVVCVQIVQEPADWQSAMGNCKEKLGNLLVLDNYGELNYFLPEFESSFSLGEELVRNNVEEFWSGMHMVKGRLMWDDYGPKYVEKAKFSDQSWRWADGQPNPTVGNCGMASVNKRITDEGPVYNFFTAVVNLTACGTKLPFVCRKPPVLRVVKTAAFCPENWLGNQYIPHCYRIFKEPVSFQQAKTRCQEEGTDIAPSNTVFDLYFLEAVFDFYSQNDKYFEVTTITNVWVEDTNTTQRCSALNTRPTESRLPVLDDVECSSSLLFMCIKKTKFAGSGFIETRSPYFDQSELLKYLPFEELPVYGVLDRNLQKNEVIFVRTPSVILNSTNLYRQWNFNSNLNWLVRESDRVSVPYYVNISIPFNQTPQGRRRRSDAKNGYAVGVDREKRQLSGGETTPSDFIETTPRPDFTETPPPSEGGVFPPEEEGFRFINYDNVRLTTGYYTFGIYNTNPPRYMEREPQLVRFSEKDLYIYVVYCDFLEGVIGTSSQEADLTIEDLTAFNLLQDDSYLSRTLTNEMLSLVLNSYPGESEVPIDYYKAQIEAFQGNTVKFRVFVAPMSSRLLTASYEQQVQDVVYDHFDRFLPLDFFQKRTLKVRSTVMCPFEQTVVEGKNLTFESVRAGETGFSWERCYPYNKALATSTCKGGYDAGAVWRDISLAEDCGTVPEYNISDSTNDLKNLSETEITGNNYWEILNDTVDLTDPGLNLTEADVIYTAEILYNYLQVGIENTPEVMSTVLKVVDNVLRSGSDVIDSAQRITNAANRIILSVDDLTNALNLLGETVVQIIEDLVASEVWEQTGTDDLTIGINLNNSESSVITKEALSSVRQPGDVVVMGTDTAIYLTESLVKGGKSRLAFHIYGNTDLFSVISSRFKVNSKVAAARLTKDDIPILELGDEYVTAVFYPFEVSNNLVCAYWNYSANEDGGGWNTEGCTLFSYESDRVVCKCNHLTNFAVLIDLEADTISDTDKVVLGIITKVGLCISIVGLGITIVTFLIFKHLRSGRGQQVLVNLSVAMICSAVLFLVGVDRTNSYGGCIAVSVLLHYFILVTFMWMLVEGVLQYLRFVKVLGTYIPKFMIKSMIPAWGIPLIPVIIVLAVDHDMYFGGNGYCWLSWEPFLYAFLIPVAVIILVNIIVFTMVLCNLCRRKNKGMVSNQSERKMAFLHFQAGLSILVILGLTWVFGFLTIDDTRIVFHYLFAIFNAFQGFFIFLLFTAREKQIRKAWRKLLCKKKPYKSSTSGTDSHGRKQSADTTNSTGLLSKSAGTDSLNTSNGSRGYSNGDQRFTNPHYDDGI